MKKGAVLPLFLLIRHFCGCAAAEGSGSMGKRKEKMEPKEKNSVGMEVYEWLQCVVMALVVCILAFVFAGRVIGVDGDSMVPTLLDRDKVIISNLLGEPKQGDVVVLTKRAFSNEPIVKRVIATAATADAKRVFFIVAKPSF